ncbi:uncharacterized protein EMH_0096410 [Eimeria mitis]|uniref:Uncharacterized protein n=1 Tax=Eimeria mitis TaxID=44415 RepID=U6KFJ5_9EIME|nr:uncharacterized protein EMH_0096410 [Eimeria mitis]CDJ36805.1 hypothetical protein EMH_0096410 [Eimeria mitis]
MVLNAAVKMRLADTALLEELAAHVQRLVRRSRLPVRDLAVVAQGFACAAYTDSTLFATLAEEAMNGLGEATILDMARLLQAFASAAAQRCPHEMLAAAAAAAGGVTTNSSSSSSSISSSDSSSNSSNSSEEVACAAPHRRLFNACVEAVSERIAFASPADLAVAAQAFGLALLQSQGTDAEALQAVLQHIR